MPPHSAALPDVPARVAVVHDWMTVPGGSEKVVVELLSMLPQAELYTSVYDPEPWGDVLAGRLVHTSWLDRIPGARRHYPRLLPLMNAAFESFELGDHDLVISSSHSCAKNVLTPPGTLHVCYCHTPMRHAWEPRLLHAEQLGRFSAVAAGAVLPRLRRADLAGAARPDVFVANSSFVAARIAKYYRRSARVIHPPVDVERHLARPRAEEDYYLVLGRIVPYKRVDVAAAACRMLGRPLKVAGDGRGLEAARAAAGPETEFLGYVPDEAVGDLLAGARAVLCPAEEDFGIVAVEAQAAGVPVIAYRRGGARDSVIDGQTGVLHDEQTAPSLASAILAFESRSFDEAAIRSNARRFGADRFRAEMTDLIVDHLAVEAAA